MLPRRMTSALTFLGVCLCFYNAFCQNGEPCTTLEGHSGTCLSLTFCEPYFDLLRDSTNVNFELSFQLRDGQCRSDGNEQMVCCPVRRPPPIPPATDPPSTTSIFSLDTIVSPVQQLFGFLFGGNKDDMCEENVNAEDGAKDSLPLLQETCTTVEDGVGKCELLRSCAPYHDLIRQGKITPVDIQLRDNQCGSDGSEKRICCPLQVPSISPPTDGPSSRFSLQSDYIPAFPESPVCGFSLAHLNRVVGGINAKLGNFPWMALLGIERDDRPTPNWICGGTLISQRHVLTAAHCIKNELNVVRVGELDFERDNDGATPMDLPIKHKIKHEDFEYTYFTNDIGLLILGRDVEFTKLIKPICIPKRADLRANSFVDYTPFVAGWGRVDNRGTYKSHLQVAQLNVKENSLCVIAYESRKIDERVMCVGSSDGKDSCSGDSGGPLMQPVFNQTTRNAYFYQTGVVSYGHKICGQSDSPGVYTRVTYFIPWLQKHVLGLDE